MEVAVEVEIQIEAGMEVVVEVEIQIDGFQ